MTDSYAMTFIRTLILIIIFCVTPGDVVSQTNMLVDAYQSDANRIIEESLADSSGFERLAYMSDTFGHRFSGSENLERALDWIMEMMIADSLENVRGEEVMVPKWVRGQESLQLLEPGQERSLQILGLGGSVGTPPEGITAEVLVVRSLDELNTRSEEAQGKIVLFNTAFTTYGQTVLSRVNGAIWAAKAGAVASLLRSVGPVSLYTPHTGTMRYDRNVPPIPHAAVTIEDAMMMQRMQDRGQRISVRLKMEAETLPDVPSRNVIAEIRGWEAPEEVVVVGGHSDSWDVGQGAMDDGGGIIASWEILRILNKLGLRPRRTIRVVLWTNEENGIRGGNAYRDKYMEELDDHVLAIETDSGVFKPQGFGFSGSDEAYAIIQEIGKLLESIESGTIRRGGGGADIGPIMREGVPGMGLVVDGEKYFWYHHTSADTIDKLDPHEFNLCVATLAVMTYVVADMPERLPR